MAKFVLIYRGQGVGSQNIGPSSILHNSGEAPLEVSTAFVGMLTKEHHASTDKYIWRRMACKCQGRVIVKNTPSLEGKKTKI